MRDITSIAQCIEEMLQLLEAAGEAQWSETLHTLRARCDTDESPSDQQEALRGLRRLYAGMGSFNDLVLHRGGQPLNEENNRLDDLRRRLWELLHHQA